MWTSAPAAPGVVGPAGAGAAPVVARASATGEPLCRSVCGPATPGLIKGRGWRKMGDVNTLEDVGSCASSPWASAAHCKVSSSDTC